MSKPERDEQNRYPGIYRCVRCGGLTYVCERNTGQPGAPDYRYLTDCCGYEHFDEVEE